MQNKRVLSLSSIGFVLLFILAAGTAVLLFTHQAKAGETAVQATEKIIVSLSNNTTTWSDDTLYTISPVDGSGKTKLYDFQNHPKFTTGEIWGPRLSKDGKYIYFHSEHAYIYTPARRNAFRITSGGSGLDQITPGENSGIWGKTGNSTVSGWVKKSDGSPWIGAPVYLEGMDSVNSGVDGSFVINNVPPGVRWLVAYRPDLSAYDSTAINVVSGVNNSGLGLLPDGTWRANFEFPVAYGERIYYQNNRNIEWTDLEFSEQHTVYTPSAAGCVTLSTADAFDIAPTSGRLAVFDHHGDGCSDNAGIYITDKDGGNKQILFNMWSETNWSESLSPVQIFWSPDESKIALQGIRDNTRVVVVIHSSTGAVLGITYANTSSMTLTLHGWDPDGNWLLISSYDGSPAQSTLARIKVKSDGSLDHSEIYNLLVNQPISGATWGNISEPDTVYLPLIVK